MVLTLKKPFLLPLLCPPSLLSHEFWFMPPLKSSSKCLNPSKMAQQESIYSLTCLKSYKKYIALSFIPPFLLSF